MATASNMYFTFASRETSMTPVASSSALKRAHTPEQSRQNCAGKTVLGEAILEEALHCRCLCGYGMSVRACAIVGHDVRGD
jgi:hypothetical protein